MRACIGLVRLPSGFTRGCRCAGAGAPSLYTARPLLTHL